MSQEAITFIHLSDIHFTKYSGDRLDLDADLRNEILIDIKNNAKREIGKVDGILVCGDIAFSGKSDEYSRANQFLKEVCSALDIPETSVFCVPGNHDVDQSVMKNSEGLFNIQEKIEEDNTDSSLTAYLRDPIFNKTLFLHIHQYNTKFAGKFMCHINENQFFWNKYFTLNDNSILRLVGLNSIVISSSNDTNERLMVVGEYQIPERQEGITYLSLCHHPPECWKDPDDILKNKMNERVRVQLYGHKHVQQVRHNNNSLIIGSGATHPHRSEREWKPRYNWLSVSVEGTKDHRKLKVILYPRILNETNDHFISDSSNCSEKNYTEYFLTLDYWKDNVKIPSEGTEPSKLLKVPDNHDEENLNTKDNCIPLRTLVYRFLELSFIKRSSILTKLNLIDEADEGIDHVDIIEKTIQKAMEGGTIQLLWDEINALYDADYK
ncbi:metallophosphoesterase [Metallumcola ferriviriculae]|uniref:Metallophosphoesterase n=1 Tax=Metallumcola ferriviriculae TaxID=3039180 RepID=A0AAU0UM28_9FIRM|nr:metallophosphoesterase [Desulfitibacteraceae bacterium MK1]